MIKMVNNSNLPNNIKKDKNHFPIEGIWAKLSVGPTEPIAGPTLPSEVATAPIAEVKSKPMRAITKVPITNIPR